jgi:hypothetical protein
VGVAPGLQSRLSYFCITTYRQGPHSLEPHAGGEGGEGAGGERGDGRVVGVEQRVGAVGPVQHRPVQRPRGTQPAHGNSGRQVRTAEHTITHTVHAEDTSSAQTHHQRVRRCWSIGHRSPYQALWCTVMLPGGQPMDEGDKEIITPSPYPSGSRVWMWKVTQLVSSAPRYTLRRISISPTTALVNGILLARAARNEAHVRCIS